MNLNTASLNIGADLVLRKTALESSNAQLSKIADTYSEWSKLVFLFDVSGSMSASVAQDKTDLYYIEQYLWPPEKMTEIRQRIAAVITAANAIVDSTPITASPIEDEDSEENSEIEEEDPADALIRALDDSALLKVTERNNRHFSPITSDDLELKRAIVVTHDLAGAFTLEYDYGVNRRPKSRIEMVRKLATQEIQARFKKYPRSMVTAIVFADDASVLVSDGTVDQLNLAISSLHTDGMPGTGYGGTEIMNAIDCGVKACTARPSPVGIHHFVLVTDGGDYQAGVQLPSWKDNLKASGVTIDYIHIGNPDEVNIGIKEACEALGGTYACVNSEKEIEEKFVQAVNRLMLPPAA